MIQVDNSKSIEKPKTVTLYCQSNRNYLKFASFSRHKLLVIPDHVVTKPGCIDSYFFLIKFFIKFLSSVMVT